MSEIFDQFGKDRAQAEFDTEFRKITGFEGDFDEQAQDGDFSGSDFFEQPQLTDWELANMAKNQAWPGEFMVETETRPKKGLGRRIGKVIAKCTGWDFRGRLNEQVQKNLKD